MLLGLEPSGLHGGSGNMGRPTKRAAHRSQPYCKLLRSSIDHHIRLRQLLDHNDVNSRKHKQVCIHTSRSANIARLTAHSPLVAPALRHCVLGRANADTGFCRDRRRHAPLPLRRSLASTPQP
ncbi:hypothetical protein EVAR_88829_1 [Eumeta japonica]|uniref:Uncharacterized protein n=1 Tax=Eumeta variegata TaxID=151549 RepID=A0A4C1Y8B3_EUMVA|nr:hypothetical protein EVAR_88829_1 [Eumeta japonica]